MITVKTIAVIPARGGSKRIPGKNIKEFCGKPMIAYSIEAAIRSNLFDQVVVSTDDSEIARIAIEYGATSPFERPTQLSDDHTPTLPVIRHAIEAIEAQQQTKLEFVCCIYATAPFLTAPNLIEGHDSLKLDTSLDFAFSVTSYAFPIQRALYVDPEGGTVKMFQPEYADTRSQDLREAYHDAGQFYWGRRDAFLNCDNMFAARSAPVVLPRDQVQDIDTPEDWDCAEQLFRFNQV
ncbi:MAG TPA: pseudaminic acid cytidylyltransferase [Opitutae bacterium]|nr:pseudaminic acid cytidylyltransferase [Puniceicoccaceae bacterium]HBR94196.1 pseudaminic acid cytidylyltransferase [Opitutae bacterium]|tara:strand:- start:7548 stop:8255 length:708 start_codon:yes stop_codon:yes gene_type:complete